MAQPFARVRILINCYNDLGGSGSETWDLLTTDPDLIRTRATALCRARAGLLGTQARLMGFTAALMVYDDANPMLPYFRTTRRLLGRGFGAPLVAATPPAPGLDAPQEAYAGLRSTAARSVVYYADGSRSLARLCFPWFLATRDTTLTGWAAGGNLLTSWNQAVARYKTALTGGPSGLPFGRWSRVLFANLNPAADAISTVQSSDFVSTLRWVFVKGNVEARYPVNAPVTIYGRKYTRRGIGYRGRQGGHYRVGQPGGKYNSETGFTAVPLSCTLYLPPVDPCLQQGWIAPDKWAFKQVGDLSSEGHGTTRRATSRGRHHQPSLV